MSTWYVFINYDNINYSTKNIIELVQKEVVTSNYVYDEHVY